MTVRKTTFKNPTGRLDMSFSEGVEILQDTDLELDWQVADQLHTIKGVVPQYQVEVFSVEHIEIKYTDGTTIRYERYDEDTN